MKFLYNYYNTNLTWGKIQTHKAKGKIPKVRRSYRDKTVILKRQINDRSGIMDFGLEGIMDSGIMDWKWNYGFHCTIHRKFWFFVLNTLIKDWPEPQLKVLKFFISKYKTVKSSSGIGSLKSFKNLQSKYELLQQSIAISKLPNITNVLLTSEAFHIKIIF